MTNSFFTLGDADKNGNDLSFDFYLSEDCPPINTPPQKILKHRRAKIQFKEGRDAQDFFNILTMGIMRFEILE